MRRELVSDDLIKSSKTGSRYEAHDLDGDGIVTDEEIAREKEMVELELREEKARGTTTHGVDCNGKYDCYKRSPVYTHGF